MPLTIALAHLGADMAANPEVTVLARELASVADVKVVPWGSLLTNEPSVDIAQIFWPEWLVDRYADDATLRAQCAEVLDALDKARYAGTRVSWVVNNVQPHELAGGLAVERYLEQFAQRVDCLVSPASGVLREAVAADRHLVALPQAVVRYGDMSGVYEAAPVGRESARQALGLEPTAAVGLCLGVMRPYKNLGLIARLFEESSARHVDRRLIVAGHPADVGVLAELRLIEERCPGLQILAHRLEEKEISLLLAASDVVIIGSHAAVNSGVANLAVSLGCSVLMPNRGAGVDLASELTADAIMTYAGGLSGNVLDDAFLRFGGAAASRGTSPIPFLSWDQAAAQFVAFYRDVIRLPPRRSALSVLPRKNSPGGQFQGVQAPDLTDLPRSTC